MYEIIYKYFFVIYHYIDAIIIQYYLFVIFILNNMNKLFIFHFKSNIKNIKK